MRVILSKWFARFVRKERINRAQLCDALERAENGLVDADLGGGVIKQRIARVGQGKSGGYRVLIVLRRWNLAVFIVGFAKHEQDNVDVDELRAIKAAAHDLLKLSDQMLDELLQQGVFTEINCDKQIPKK